ncbi:Pullulanase [Streptococcus infantarius subsp. infantarius]|nr:Pullulanase [Streptococcus infantarius subsp. infantarius]
MKNTVIVHYHSQHGNYFDYSLWKWIDLHEGTDSQFSGFDSFGLVGNLTIDSPFFLEHIYVIVKNHNWSIKTRDFRIQRNSGVPKTEVWIVEGMIRFIIHIKRQLLVIIIVIVIVMPLIWQ